MSTTIDFALDGLAAQIFADVAEMTRDVEGVSRDAFSPRETAVLDYLADVARRHGLKTTTDAGANLVIARPNDGRPGHSFGLLGSHVDSVPRGGNYDGLAGTVAALLTLIELERTAFRGDTPVRAIALRGEESACYGQAYMGSRMLFGRLSEKEMDAPHRSTGEPLRAAIERLGIPLARVAAGEQLLDPATVAFFVELHIEQGPLLIDRQWRSAAVTAIRGNIRHRAITCLGEAGHSGAVPRWLRHDAVFATAELLMRMDEHWATIQQKGGDLVITAGIFQTDAAVHSMSRIPGEVTFSFEARSQDSETLRAVESLLRAECRMIERERGVRFVLDEPMDAGPAELDPRLVEVIRRACKDEGGSSELVASGAGHDAAVFAQAGVSAGMIFVRNAHGSHNPHEDMELADFMCGLRAMIRATRRLAG